MLVKVKVAQVLQIYASGLMISFSTKVHFVDSIQMEMCVGARVPANLHSKTTLVNP